MSNDFYNEAFTGVAGQTARAEQVETQFSAIAAAFDEIQAILYATVRIPNTETANVLGNAAARAGKYLSFNGAGQPVLTVAPFKWRGDWVPTFAYEVGDIVKAGAFASIYICVTAHTSGVSFVDTNWDIMIDLQSLNVVRNQIITASRTALAGFDYMIDSSGGNVVLTLPAAPSILDAPINVTHIGGSLGGGQTVTIARNGLRIMSLQEDLVFDRANQSISLMYSDASRGWRLRVLT